MTQEPLFCICRQPFTDGAFYLGCDGCNDWLHGECVGINEFEGARIAKYYCPRCRSRGYADSTATARHVGRSLKLSLKRRLPVAVAYEGESHPVIRPDVETAVPSSYIPSGEASHIPQSSSSDKSGFGHFDARAPFVGLPNPGGDLCSLNSVIQALSVALKRVDFNYSETQPQPRDEKSDGISEEATLLLRAVVEANARLSHQETVPVGDEPAAPFVQPHGLALARSLRAAHPGRFPAGTQHDAQDVLLSLLEGQGSQGVGSETGTCSEAVSHADANAFKLDSGLFVGKSQARLECLTCHHTSTR